MLNPIVKNRSYLMAYLMVLFFVVAVQTVVLNYYQDLDVLASLTDALVFNLMMAIIGFVLWYVLRFNLKEKTELFDLVVNHALVAILSVTIWLGGGYFIMQTIENNNTEYLDFLQASLPWRGIIGSFYYLVFVLLYYIMMYYEDLQHKMKAEAELSRLVREAELNALKSQINPHFLFNSLNSISSLTMTDPDKAQEMVIKLSDFMRYALSHDRHETTLLRNELENAERYLDIEKVRFGKRLKYNAIIPPACLDAQIPNLILQPLLENAIKHGVHNSTEEVLIELRCEPNNDFIELHIINDFDPEATRPKGEGIGLRNIRQRLQLLYHRNDLLEIKLGKIEFEVILRIPRQRIG
ncbi:MAG: histidine kinase [Bacteroidetes bacterium]|nr:histidine kinase [Bacteroidota bacterium]